MRDLVERAKELAANVSGASAVTMLAAYVEMIEPTPPDPGHEREGRDED